MDGLAQGENPVLGVVLERHAAATSIPCADHAGPVVGGCGVRHFTDRRSRRQDASRPNGAAPTF